MSEEEFDRRLGAALRARRMMLGLSQTALAEMAAITYQQVQRYESGDNRIAASRLWTLAYCLHTRAEALLAAALEGGQSGLPSSGPSVSAPVQSGVVSQRQIVALVAAFQNIPDRTLRRAVLNMARACAAVTEPD